MRSAVTEGADKATRGPVLPAESVTERAVSLNTTVPSEQEVAVTVIDVPEEAEGVKTQPVADPAFEKSAEVKPETASEKVRI